MPFSPLPASAAWTHLDARDGFEVSFFAQDANRCTVRGVTAAVEDAEAWGAEYEIELDAAWRTRRARIVAQVASGARETVLESDGAGLWRVDGRWAPELGGCLDVDLESSAMTNTFPVHRLALLVGDAAAAPAASVRAGDLRVERLVQHYKRASDEHGHHRYEYHAPAFDISCSLSYDAAGLLLDYPGLAVRYA